MRCETCCTETLETGRTSQLVCTRCRALLEPRVPMVRPSVTDRQISFEAYSAPPHGRPVWDFQIVASRASSPWQLGLGLSRQIDGTSRTMYKAHHDKNTDPVP